MLGFSIVQHEDVPQQLEVKPTANTHFAWMRTRMAADRTFMAWLRTAASLIGFGFTIIMRALMSG